MDSKVNELSGGLVKGAGSMIGGIANMVTHPVETASGLYAMAEHAPVMLCIAHKYVEVLQGVAFEGWL